MTDQQSAEERKLNHHLLALLDILVSEWSLDFTLSRRQSVNSESLVFLSIGEARKCLLEGELEMTCTKGFLIPRDSPELRS